MNNLVELVRLHVIFVKECGKTEMRCDFSMSLMTHNWLCRVCRACKRQPWSESKHLFFSKTTSCRYISELYRGSLVKKSNDQALRLGHTKLPFFGKGQGMAEQDAIRFVRKLVVEGYVREKLYSIPNQTAAVLAYAELTESGTAVATGRTKAKVEFFWKEKRISMKFRFICTLSLAKRRRKTRES